MIIKKFVLLAPIIAACLPSSLCSMEFTQFCKWEDSYEYADEQVFSRHVFIGGLILRSQSLQDSISGNFTKNFVQLVDKYLNSSNKFQIGDESQKVEDLKSRTLDFINKMYSQTPLINQLNQKTHDLLRIYYGTSGRFSYKTTVGELFPGFAQLVVWESLKEYLQSHSNGIIPEDHSYSPRHKSELSDFLNSLKNLEKDTLESEYIKSLIKFDILNYYKSYYPENHLISKLVKQIFTELMLSSIIIDFSDKVDIKHDKVILIISQEEFNLSSVKLLGKQIPTLYSDFQSTAEKLLNERYRLGDMFFETSAMALYGIKDHRNLNNLIDGLMNFFTSKKVGSNQLNVLLEFLLDEPTFSTSSIRPQELTSLRGPDIQRWRFINVPLDQPMRPQAEQTPQAASAQTKQLSIPGLSFSFWGDLNF